MAAPQLSVVVPTRGGARRLPVLLDALCEQDLDADWELIVVIDGDVDGTRETVELYRSRLPLRILEQPTSAGVSAALARGYDAARGDVVLRCDDDLTPGPGFLARHLAWHSDRPQDAPLGVIALTRDVFEDTHYAEAYGRPANRRLLAAAYQRPPSERWMHWAACNSVPRSAYDAVGGFDPSMVYREDSELGLRLARHGVEMVIDPDLEIEHRCPATTASARAARAYTSGASTRTFEDRHPDSAAAPGAPSAWTRLVDAGARRVRDQEDAARLGGLVDRALPRTPPALRGKLVAWAVEAAAAAGRRVGYVAWVRTGATAAAPSLAVVIPHHGDPEPTVALVRRLREQREEGDLQIVVVDDASPRPLPPVEEATVVRREANGGFGSAVNTGVARISAASHVLVLNSDLEVPLDFVDAMAEAAARHPHAVLSPRVEDEAGHPAWTGRRFPRTGHQVVEWLTPLARWRHTALWHRSVGHDMAQAAGVTEVDWVVGAAVLVPVDEFRAVGGFDERFFMNAEEVDLQRRLRARGVRSFVLDHPTVTHEGGGSSPSQERRRWLVESRLAYADKWGGRRRLQAGLTVATGLNLVVNAARRARGRDVAPLTVARDELRLIAGRRRA